MIYISLLNWIKEIFITKDNAIIGLTQLKEDEIPVIKEIQKQKINKNKKDIKISDLMRGETH